MAEKKILTIEGMNCEHCAKRVEESLSTLPEVKSVKVNLKKGIAKVKLMAPVAEATLTNVIEEAGYKRVD